MELFFQTTLTILFFILILNSILYRLAFKNPWTFEDWKKVKADDQHIIDMCYNWARITVILEVILGLFLFIILSSLTMLIFT